MTRLKTAGWGDTCGRIRESLQLLLDIIQAPSLDTLEAFLSRLPLVFRVVVLSPHGFFGQGVECSAALHHVSYVVFLFSFDTFFFVFKVGLTRAPRPRPRRPTSRSSA